MSGNRWRETLGRVGGSFNERPIRERVLITVTALVFIVFVGWELAVSPGLVMEERLQAREAALENSRDGLLAQQDALDALLDSDPSKELRNRLEQRQARLDRLDDQIAELTGRLIPPKAMVSLLKVMLEEQQSLRLISLELKQPTPIYVPEPGPKAGGEEAVPSDPPPLLYAHDAELIVQGGYLEVFRYLQHLESVDKRLGWEVFDYRTGEWPQGEAVIRVRTYSLEPMWLGV